MHYVSEYALKIGYILLQNEAPRKKMLIMCVKLIKYGGGCVIGKI